MKAYRLVAAAAIAALPAAPVLAQDAPPAPITSPIARSTGPSLTLDTAVELFLRRNALLEAARLEVDAAAAERIAAGLRPRPGLTASMENMPVGGDTPFSDLYEVTVSIAQPIELGGRAGHRRDVAERMVSLAEARLAVTLRRRLSELKRVYFEALLARTVTGVERESREHFGELVRYNTVRFEEGEIAEGDLIRVRLERTRHDSAVAAAELAYSQAKIRLLERTGETELQAASALEVEGDLAGPKPTLDLAALRQAALANRPEVKAAEAELALADARIGLERSIAKGDLTPYAGYRRVGPDNTVVAGVTVPLPFGNRNQAGIARAEAERRVTEANVRAARSAAVADVEAAFRAYETARAQVLLYEREILRQADESRDIQLAAYREGAVPLFAVMDAQRTRAEARAAYARALFDFRMSLVELELATGTEIQ